VGGWFASGRETTLVATDDTMKQKRGFTLIELLVVMGIMVLLIGIALPALTNLMSSSASNQTYELFAGALNRARAIAYSERVYTCVHVQVVNPAYVKLHPDLENTHYMAILVLDDTLPAGTILDATNDVDGDGKYDGKFFQPRKHSNSQISTKYGTIEPKALPRGWALGGVDSPWVEENSDGITEFVEAAATGLDGFTTVTVIFNPDGQVVTSIAGKGAPMGDDAGLFGESALWQLGSGDTAGVMVVTIVDYEGLKYMEDDEEKADVTARLDWLNENGQFLSINVFTGHLFPRVVPPAD